MTVKPPPVTAPASTAYFNCGQRPSTWLARKVIAALSLKDVRMVAPMNSGHSLRLEMIGAEPPALEAAVDDQSGEEESDQHGAAQVDFILVVGGGLREREEEQEAADEQRRIVGERHGPGHEGEVGDA